MVFGLHLAFLLRYSHGISLIAAFFPARDWQHDAWAIACNSEANFDNDAGGIIDRQLFHN